MPAPKKPNAKDIDTSFLNEAMGTDQKETAIIKEPSRHDPAKKKAIPEPDKKGARERIYVSIPGELKQEARLQALKEKITFNDLVIEAIKQYLEKE